MKKLVAFILCMALVITCVACFAACNPKDGDSEASYNKNWKVAMVTDYGDITDQSFNQTTYEACKWYCEEFNIEFQYYKPTGDSTAERVASVNQAVAAGYNVIVMPGYAFAGTIVEVASKNPTVKFIAMDVAQGDLFEAYYGKEYDHNPSNPKWTYELPSNVACFVYQEEIAGYFAGYAAVKEGFRKLGFLGGMAVPAVQRYGYGFVQGANAAAVELNVAKDVEIKYGYGNQFYGDADITAKMDTWYGAGTEVVFACGGGIYSSACEAAKKVDKFVIGVDVDQSAIINAYRSDMCVTSAMKGLAATTKTALANLMVGNWSLYSGKVQKLGLIGTDVEANYVQLPTATWTMKNFTVEEYKALEAKIFNGEIVVNASTEAMPTTEIKVDNQGNLK